MKKYVFVGLVLLLTGSIWAAQIDTIGPSIASSNLTISAPGNGERNCLTYLVISSTGHAATGYITHVLSADTTNYRVTVTTGAHQVPISDANPFCASTNEALKVNVVTSGSFTINYKGYIGDK